MTNSKLSLLLQYAGEGWPIFPCRPMGKEPLTPEGLKNATADETQIRTWHGRHPDANWAIRTGSREDGGAGILAVDIDPKNEGIASWEMLRDENPGVIETPTVRTGGAGYHYYFAHPDSLDARNTAGKLGKGIDTRANGGYVIVPPSRTDSDYEFEIDLETELQEIPAWILTSLNGHRGGEAVPVAEALPEEIEQGERHDWLVRTAGAMRNTGMDGPEIAEALLAISDARYVGTHSIPDSEIDDIAAFVVAKPRGFKTTDLGNAERFNAQHGADLRYCYDTKSWLKWDGKRWGNDAEPAVEKMAYNTARNIYNEAANTSDPGQRKALGKWAVQSEARWRIKSMVDLARPFKPVRMSELDANPWVLNCRNGTLDLRTGDLLEHDKRMLLTRVLDVDFIPGAECPAWLNHLELVTGGDKALQLYLQKLMGYALTGNTDEHAIFFLFGAGNNGKSVTIEAMLQLLGDYAQRTRIEALLASWQHGDAANPYVAGLAGARFVVASEIPAGRKINESLVKDLSGGDRLTARFLNQNPFEFVATHKLFLAGNYKPKVSGDDLGFWRRIHVVPFKKTISRDQRRPMSDLLAEFEAEASGILGWAAAGCLFWQSDGRLVQPDAVSMATAEYKGEEDILQRFIEDECETDGQVLKSVLYTRFKTWAEDEGERDAAKLSKKWLTQRLSRRGYESGGQGRASILGLQLNQKPPLLLRDASE